MSTLDAFPRERHRANQQLEDWLPNHGTVVGTQQVLFGGNVIQDLPQKLTKPYGRWSSESTFDELHKRCKTRGHGGKYHVGGPFLAKKIEYEYSGWSGTITTPWQSPFTAQYRYDGELIPVFSPGAPSFSNVLVDGEGDVSGYGAQAWRKFRPGKPKVSLSTFIGEMRDLPRMLQIRARRFKDLGSGYLNYQFGWAPFLRDIRKMYDLSQHLDAEVRKIVESNGKWLLRRGSVATDSDTSRWEDTGLPAFGFRPGLTTGQLGVQSSIRSTGTETFSRRVWFSGRFRYYIPHKVMQGDYWSLNMKRKLFGLTLTPDVVWELIPWSWLIDYFANIGDIMSNISGGSVDAVAKYAYVMGSTTFAQEQRSEFAPNATETQYITGWCKRSRTYKHRVAANPFGFDMGDIDLSASQIAILTALGISRWG